MAVINGSLLDINTNDSELLCKLVSGKNPFYCRNRTHRFKDLDQTVRILLYSLIFLLSVLGNTLVIIVLIRNKRMRTVTNIFLLSLAISDLMLCFFCMPFTFIPNILQDFIFGRTLCKITSYFMGTPRWIILGSSFAITDLTGETM
uniref:Uncharacterized protein n=1 Tax=Sphaerodactylus townsendi TaxID=933632 RepID=A0ACB8E701_9SAUR